MGLCSHEIYRLTFNRVSDLVEKSRTNKSLQYDCQASSSTNRLCQPLRVPTRPSSTGSGRRFHRSVRVRIVRPETSVDSIDWTRVSESSEASGRTRSLFQHCDTRKCHSSLCRPTARYMNNNNSYFIIIAVMLKRWLHYYRLYNCEDIQCIYTYTMRAEARLLNYSLNLCLYLYVCNTKILSHAPGGKNSIQEVYGQEYEFLQRGVYIA